MVFLLQPLVGSIENLDIESICKVLLSNGLACSMYEPNDLPNSEENFRDVEFYAVLKSLSGRPSIFVKW